MDTSGISINLLTSIIGGAFVAWLFAPTDVTGQALRRLKIMGEHFVSNPRLAWSVRDAFQLSIRVLQIRLL